MSSPFSFAAAAMLAGASVVAAQPANLSVVFVHPETFRDAVYSQPYGDEQGRAPVLRDIERHLRQLADRVLPPGESLHIEVLDIDLAGWFEPFRRPTYADIRTLRDITWPRILLRYKLMRGDQLVASAEEQVADLNYLMTVNSYPVGDRLRFEKAMLDVWFDRRFVTSAEHS